LSIEIAEREGGVEGPPRLVRCDGDPCKTRDEGKATTEASGLFDDDVAGHLLVSGL
jgi:hypothetical protein